MKTRMPRGRRLVLLAGLALSLGSAGAQPPTPVLSRVYSDGKIPFPVAKVRERVPSSGTERRDAPHGQRTEDRGQRAE